MPRGWLLSLAVFHLVKLESIVVGRAANGHPEMVAFMRGEVMRTFASGHCCSEAGAVTLTSGVGVTVGKGERTGLRVFVGVGGTGDGSKVGVSVGALVGTGKVTVGVNSSAISDRSTEGNT